ncbi:tyrosine-type recombinase/integrase [Thermoplasmatota archaeon]
MNGISKNWLNKARIWIEDYLNYCNYSIEEKKTLEYIKKLMDNHSIIFYRKKTYQIRKFLLFLKKDWAKDIQPPAEPIKNPKRISINEIKNSLDYFRYDIYFKQIRAIILLGSNSGMRALELYQLKREDIDLDNRIVHVNHNPENGQSTKTKRSRISFFNIETQSALKEYFDYFNNGNNLKILFSKTHMERLFSKAPIRVKELRKFFSQEWDRNGGATSIKKILMGHSLKGDVDLMHYNFQSEDDLKNIYDKIIS